MKELVIIAWNINRDQASKGEREIKVTLEEDYNALLGKNYFRRSNRVKKVKWLMLG